MPLCEDPLGDGAPPLPHRGQDLVALFQSLAGPHGLETMLHHRCGLSREGLGQDLRDCWGDAGEGLSFKGLAGFSDKGPIHEAPAAHGLHRAFMPASGCLPHFPVALGVEQGLLLQHWRGACELCPLAWQG
eukprot:8756839-Lingulodinium_polyedra.AAC.1